ncbi:MAG: hypothetical protein Q9183_001437 [Haloplaca sp. 2 TL-2023]
MAPSGGHLLVPKVLRIVKFTATQAGSLIRSKLPQVSAGTTNAVLQPIYLHSKAQPIHPHAFLRQSRSSALRKFSTHARLHSQRIARPTFQSSNIGKAVTRSFGAPFASTLRPNLTGGALPRTAGGYGLGGSLRGVRQFSHTSGAQAQVVHNVSAGMRAFCIGGGKARFDGFDHQTGAKRFKVVSEAEDCTLRTIEKSRSAWVKGTNLDFRLNPTITALSPSLPTSTGGGFSPRTLTSIGFLDTLSVDFARALKDLSAILTDLTRLAAFGELPVSLTKSQHGSTLSVRFPGCDADTVGRLCDEVGIHRGVIREDEAWNSDKDVEMALLFPFAPSKTTSNSGGTSALVPQTALVDNGVSPEQLDWQHMMSPADPAFDDDLTSYNNVDTPLSSQTAHLGPGNVRNLSPSGYESLQESDFGLDDPYYHHSSPSRQRRHQHSDLQGLESIYRFLAECDDARR